MLVYSLQIGNIKKYSDENKKEFSSALIKNIYQDRITIDINGVNKDCISDTKNHGGTNKAVFANALSNYKIWNDFLGKKLNIGDMGENITMKNLDENSVFIGDIHYIGSCILQVSQPRKPCAKLYKIHKNRNFTKFIFSSGLSGWYYKVLKSGECLLGDEVKVEQIEKTRLSIMDLNKLFFAPKENIKLFDKLKNLNTIENNWVKTIQKRLDYSYDNSYMKEL
ncbi:MOSC domain-containing protein [Campylobacter sputorum]|uniref:MOSC domain-containing protein n=1 Tax=Campylobacter sputorum TaxID=206 RepID=UPI000B7748F8|nr:MOSC domain-containing protein [Campylobacter sputorum]